MSQALSAPPPLTATKSLNSHPSESAPTQGPILHKCR